MKLSRATQFLALCAASLLVTLPSLTHAQGLTHGPLLPGATEHATETATEPATGAPHPSAATPTPTTTTTTTTAAAPPVATTTAPAVTTTASVTTTAVHTLTTSRTTVAVVTTLTGTIAPTTTAPVLPTDGSCLNSLTCTGGQICGLAGNSTTGMCMKVANVCAAQPLQPCVTSADCLNVAFSYCAVFNGSNVCTGTGIPGTDNECQQPADNSSVMSTLKFAGIAVGSVAALGVAFALVRWQRRRQRSKMPAEMFGEMDYGAPKAVESYPFSSRPNAHGNDHAPSPPGFNDGYDNHNQYYEEPVGYTNNMHAGKMHQDQYHGHDQYDNNQYYGNGQKDDGYGYSQHGGQTNDGYYDNTGYDEYPQHPIASPAAARAASPRHQNFNAMDGYGAEPSELDFGGHGHGQVAGHGGYGGGRY